MMLPKTLVLAFGIESLASLLSLALLFSFHRAHRKPYLRDWSLAFATCTGALLGLLIDSIAAGSVGPTHPLRFLPTAIAGASTLIAILFFTAAVRGLAALGGTLTERRWLITAGIAGALLALVLPIFPDTEAVRLILEIAAPATLLCAVAVYGAWSGMRLRTAGAGAALVIFSVAMGALAVSEMTRVIGALLAAFGKLPPAGTVAIAAAHGVVLFGSALAMVIAALDEDRNKAVVAASQVEHLAYHDTLTGLPNRALFFDRLVVALAHASRHQHKLAVLFLDLDRFKLVNDSLGHSVGDGVIRSASERLRKCVRQEDTIARFGGDEFIILVSVIGRAEDASRIAQKVVESIEPPFVVGAREISITTSVGIAIYPIDGNDPETLVRNADTAMYRAKESGDPYRFYAPAMNARALEMLEMETDLRRAVAKNEFCLHYQPLIDLETGRVFGLEALLRWNHPRHGLIGPDRFMAMTESTGLIIPLGTWVLREACKQLKQWQRTLGSDLIVSVNLSPRQFEQPDLTGKVKAALEEAGIRPRHLELEITESKAMQDVEKTIRILRELKNLGVRISIDDFGTGYSSLSYLKQFPVDTLKLDQSFVREITVPEDGAIARSVIAMAHSLQLKVLAEGVETLGQLEFLRTHSCDRLQGFLFSRPLEPATFERFLSHNGRIVKVA